MRILEIDLEHIKSYRHAHIVLREGTTAISGRNGAGKTTIIEAIGFALFDYLPYSQAQFIQEQEKWGAVRVVLLGVDERRYIVERQCGSRSSWTMQDTEAGLLLEQRADVLDSLHRILDIETDRSLSELFHDAIGVPQGTFTSVFLQIPSQRKKTFDSLLQIEKYAIASDELLNTKKYIQEQIRSIQSLIERLEIETRDGASSLQQLEEERITLQQMQQKRLLLEQELQAAEERQRLLLDQKKQYELLQQQYEKKMLSLENASISYDKQKTEVALAEAATRIVLEKRAEHIAFLESEEALTQLYSQQQEQNRLIREQAIIQQNITKHSTMLQQTQKNLLAIEKAKQEIEELAPAVAEQQVLQLKLNAARRVLEHTQAIAEQIQEKEEHIATYQKDKENIQEIIRGIIPLEPLAEKLEDIQSEVKTLEIQLQNRENLLHQLLMLDKQIELLLLNQQKNERKSKQLQDILDTIEEHRTEALTYDGLAAKVQDTKREVHTLEGYIRGCRDSQKKSVGGQCPFLQESCLNILQKGSTGLDMYFADEISMTEKQCETQKAVLVELEANLAGLEPFADQLAQETEIQAAFKALLEEQREGQTQLVALQKERDTCQCSIEILEQGTRNLDMLRVQMKECKDADTEVQKLPMLQHKSTICQENILRLIQESRQLQEEIVAGSQSRNEVIQLEQTLTTLNNPAMQEQILLEKVKTEDVEKQALHRATTALELAEQEERRILHALAQFVKLEEHVQKHEQTKQRTHEGHVLYLQNEQRAQTLTGQKNLLENLHTKYKDSEEEKNCILHELEEARNAFNASNLETCMAELNTIRTNMGQNTQQIIHSEQNCIRLEKNVAVYKEKQAEQVEAVKELHTRQDTEMQLEYFRKVIKESAPYILQAVLHTISAEANRIFGEIMADHSAILLWDNNYELALRKQSSTRPFALLSGGEQMCAALALRLALIKKLTSLRIAFFDEPTQNMDDVRRANLAEQIRRVRGFEQLLVISHDDTFEQGLDSIIRLDKIQGITTIITDEMALEDEQERVSLYAS